MFGKPGADNYSAWCMDFQEPHHALNASIELYGDLVHGIWNPRRVDRLSHTEYAALIADIDKWKRRIGGHPSEMARSELRGKDLVCWCPLDQPCHADVLLELAAEGGA